MYCILYSSMYCTLHCTLYYTKTVPSRPSCLLNALFPEEHPPLYASSKLDLTIDYVLYCILYCTLHFTLYCSSYFSHQTLKWLANLTYSATKQKKNDRLILKATFAWLLKQHIHVWSTCCLSWKLSLRIVNYFIACIGHFNVIIESAFYTIRKEHFPSCI